MANKIIHKHSSVITDGQAKLPDKDQLEYGELAVNYAAGVETISLKNTEGQIVEFKSTKQIEDIIIDNEYVTANALTDLDSRVTALEEAGVEIDLSTYATKEELNDYATREELLTTEERVNKNEIVTAGALTDLDERIIDLNDCVNDLDDRIDNLNEVADSLDSRITTLEGAGVEIDLSAYATKEELGGYTTKEELSGYATKEEIETLETTLTDNEFITAAALTELNKRVETVELTTSNLNEQIPTIANKQDVLVAGENIKTINGETLLGSGDISIDTTFLTPISYTELVELRNNNNLISGMWYRITDYNTVVTSNGLVIMGHVAESASAAGHQFDIIVLATSTNTLSEEARAIQHEGDDYFNDSNLDAWKIWYCLDNDTTRFDWVDSENGKGVIYRMIDEYRNDCPYDFKNVVYTLTTPIIQCEEEIDGEYSATHCVRNPKLDMEIDEVEYFAWDYIPNDSLYATVWTKNEVPSVGEEVYDAKQIVTTALRITGHINEVYTFGANCYNNVIQPLQPSNGHYKLNSIILGDNCYNNLFGNNTHSISLGYECHDNNFGTTCFSIIMGSKCQYNTFDTYSYAYVFGHHCEFNSFEPNSSTGGSFESGYCHNINAIYDFRKIFFTAMYGSTGESVGMFDLVSNDEPTTTAETGENNEATETVE